MMARFRFAPFVRTLMALFIFSCESSVESRSLVCGSAPSAPLVLTVFPLAWLSVWWLVRRQQRRQHHFAGVLPLTVHANAST
jgi:hypothetical protein